MRIELGFECDEPWEEMAEEGGLRRCARCNESVVDLSRLTRKRALAILSRGSVCVSFLETPSGRAVVRPDAHGVSPLVGLAAGLLAACGSAGEPAPTPVAIESVAPEAPPVGVAAPSAVAPSVAAPSAVAPEPVAPSRARAEAPEVAPPLVGDPPAVDDAECATLDAPVEAELAPPGPANAGDTVASAPPLRRRRGRRHAPTTPVPSSPVLIPTRTR